MSRILTRDEFIALVDEYGRTVLLQDVEGEGRRVAEAYDAALARIAELEAENAAMAKRLINGSEPIFASNAQLRARIAREFYDEASGSAAPHAVLLRWEAAAKEGE